VVFTIGSMWCGAAPSLRWLLVARAFQGVGASLIFAVNIAMISQAFPAARRGRALGANAILVALGVSFGPTLGGFITKRLTWRWIFYVNVPVGIVVALAALCVLTECPHRSKGRFDLAGAVLFAAGLVSLTLALSLGPDWGFASWRTLLALGIAAVALAAAFVVDRHADAPLLDPTILRSRVFALSLVSFVLCMLALFAVGFLMPFYFEDLRGLDAEQSGIWLTPLSATLAIVAPVSGALSDRFGSRWLSPIGLGIACFGLWLLSRVDATTPMRHIVAALALTGLGQGIFTAPNTRTLMAAAPRHAQGVASGILATGRVMGQSLSVALAGAVFALRGGVAAGARLADGAHLPPDQIADLQETFTRALRSAFVLCAAISAVGVLTALVRGEEKR
jgi:EmrB/QacA subfamily drug resistance transporter